MRLATSLLLLLLTACQAPQQPAPALSSDVAVSAQASVMPSPSLASTAAPAAPSQPIPGREPKQAEFAVRWDPSEGGPKTAREVLKLLDASEPSTDKYEVRYFDLPSPPTAPADAIVILRERVKIGGKTQIRLKYRRKEPLVGTWTCPPGEEYEPEEEVDVSFGDGGSMKRVYSYSCTLKAKAPPKSLKAVPKSCSSTMTRYESKDIRVEEWSLPGDKTQLEVSRSAANTDEQASSFQQVFKKLSDKGVKPSDRSKTELGSQCP